MDIIISSWFSFSYAAGEYKDIVPQLSTFKKCELAVPESTSIRSLLKLCFSQPAVYTTGKGASTVGLTASVYECWCLGVSSQKCD